MAINDICLHRDKAIQNISSVPYVEHNLKQFKDKLRGDLGACKSGVTLQEGSSLMRYYFIDVITR